MTEGQALQIEESHGRFFIALEFYQITKPYRLHQRHLEINPGRRIKVKRVGFPVEKPFARRVEFLENILHETIFLMGSTIAVHLPTAFLGYFTVGVLAGNQPTQPAPEIAMHRMQEAASRIRPPGRAFLADGIGGKSIEILRVGIEVRITCENLPFAVDE